MTDLAAVTGDERLKGSEWRWALPRLAAIFLVTRILLVVVAAAVEATQSPPPSGVRWTDAPILASLTAFDGHHYLDIVTAGYHAPSELGAQGNVGFFPMYPMLVRAFAVFTLGDVATAAVVVANGAFALALICLYALSRRYLSRDAALRSIAYLAIAPGAVAFGLAYSEGPFLLFSVGSFLAAEVRKPRAAGCLYALAALTRPTGIVLGIPLFLLLARDRKLRDDRAWGWTALGPIAWAGFVAFAWNLTGDPLAIVHAQAVLPDVLNDSGASSAIAVPGRLVGPTDAGFLVPSLWLVSILFAVFLFVFFRGDRIRLPYALLAFLAVAGIFGAGRLMSAPRILGVAWPFDWALALRRSRWVHLLVPAVFIGLHVVFAWLAFTWQAAP